MIKKIVRPVLCSRGRWLPLVLLAGVLIWPAPTLAANGWSGQVTPYIWAAGVGGNITPFRGGPTLTVDDSFSEILKDLDGACVFR